MPEELTQKPFDPVPDDSTADFLAGGNTKTSRVQVVVTPHHQKPTHRCFMLRGSELKKFSPLP